MIELNRSGMTLLALGAVLILFSCAEDSTQVERTPTSIFPLTMDSRWEYQGIRYTVPFNDSTLADTMSVEVIRHIIGPDSIGNNADLVVCDDSIVVESSDVLDSVIQRRWLKLDDDKLKLFAYDEFAPGDSANPTLFDFPHNILNFPLNGGKSWIVYSDLSTQESSKVVGIEYVEFPYGWEYCDVVRSTKTDIVWGDTLIQSLIWYTDNGLMQLEYDYGISMINDDNGMLLDSARTYENRDLVQIEIQP
jgi:hypothetical protein